MEYIYDNTIVNMILETILSQSSFYRYCKMNFPVRDNKVLLYCIVLYCIVLYCIVLYCIVLYCIVLYCIVLYCIVLYYFVFHGTNVRLLTCTLNVEIPREYFNYTFNELAI